MNKTFLKVLKYIGVGCIGAVVGIGALIGVSKCSYNQQDHVENSSKYKVANASSYVTFTYNDVYSPSFIEYYNQAKEVFHVSSIGGTSFYGSVALGDTTEYTASTIYYNVEGIGLQTNRGTYGCTMVINFNDYDLSYGRFYEDDHYGSYSDYYVTNETYFNRYPYLTIKVSDTGYTSSPNAYNIFHYIRNMLDGNADKTAMIRIGDIFNYNMFAQESYLTSNINIYSLTPYITHTPPVTADDFDVYYYIPITFTANNIRWNGMRAKFSVVTSSEYMQTYDYELIPGVGSLVDGDYSDCYAYTFVSLEYYQHDGTSYSYTPVCERVFNKYDTRDPFYPYRVTWLNDEYRTIYYRYGDVLYDYQYQDDAKNVNFLTSLNNNLANYQTQYVWTDIGLSNVFELLSLAFSSWLPILNISILPGITIGLLLFLPFITGIIILIIWIVKR